MNELTFSQPQINRLNTSSQAASNAATNSDFLSISFSPSLKYLHARWLKPVESGEYRQAVRMIARSIAFLGAELTLIDVKAISELSEEDQKWSAVFLQSALSNTAIKRSARVIAETGFQKRAITTIAAESGKLHYEIGLFSEEAAAKRWLFEGKVDIPEGDENNILIPLNFNLKLLKWNVLRGNGNNMQVSPENSATAANPQEEVSLPNTLKLKTDYVAVSLNKPDNLMTIKWIKPPLSRQYRYGMLKSGRALIEHPMEHVLLDNQRLGILTLEDQSWLIGMSIELLPRTSIRKLAVVTSTDALQQLSSDAIGCKLKEANLPYVTRYFLSEEEARDWLFSTEESDLSIS